MPGVKEKKHSQQAVNPVIHMVGILTQWLKQNQTQRSIEERQRNDINLATNLKLYLTEQNIFSENKVVESFALCGSGIDRELAKVLTTCEERSRSLKLKCDLERKLREYQDKQVHPAFFSRQSEKVYRAKRAVVFGLKCYLNDEYTLHDLQSVMDEHKGHYDKGWASSLEDLITRVKAIKKEQLFAMSQTMYIQSQPEQNVLDAVVQFSYGQLTQVDLVGVYEVNKRALKNQELEALYTRALEVDPNVRSEISKNYGELVQCR